MTAHAPRKAPTSVQHDNPIPKKAPTSMQDENPIPNVEDEIRRRAYEL